jgi:alcohol dehydrogenase, propanol-preferring
MKAAVLRKLPAKTLDVSEIPGPDMPPGSVMLQVSACGICGTDLHIMDGVSYSPDLPFVLGHEPVGTVEAVSAGVDEDLLGRRMVPAIFVGCMKCSACKAGNERLCERGAQVTGVLGRWGGFAERLVLDADHLIEVPANLSDEEAASLVDAGATAHNAARVAAGHGGPGRGPVMVAGAGPVGLLAAELLRTLGAQPLVVEPNTVRRETAGQLGFTALASPGQTTGSFSVIVDCAGATEAIPGMLSRLTAHGMYICVGYGIVSQLDLAVVSRRELTIRGIRSGTKNDLEQVLAIAASRAIRLPPCHVWQLDHVNEALQALRNGTVPGKAVVAAGG